MPTSLVLLASCLALPRPFWIDSSASAHAALRGVETLSSKHDAEASVSVLDLFDGRGACGVCPGSPELKAAGTGTRFSNSPIRGHEEAVCGGVPQAFAFIGKTNVATSATDSKQCRIDRSLSIISRAGAGTMASGIPRGRLAGSSSGSRDEFSDGSTAGSAKLGG